MSEPNIRYQIRILHYVNPHLIWVVGKNKKQADEFQQLGVYGLVPMQSDIDEIRLKFVRRRSDKWAPAITGIMEQILLDAEDIYFEPKIACNMYSIFNDNIHKFGEIYITKEGEVMKLSEELCKFCFSTKNEKVFLRNLNASNLETDLNPVQIDKVIENIKKTDISSTTVRKNQCLLKDGVSAQSASGPNLNELTENNLRLHELKCGGFEESEATAGKSLLDEKLKIWKQADENRKEDMSSDESVGVPSMKMEPKILCESKVFLIKKLKENKEAKLKVRAQEEKEQERREQIAKRTLKIPAKVPRFVPTVHSMEEFPKKIESIRRESYNDMERNDAINPKYKLKEKFNYSKIAKEDKMPKPIVRNNEASKLLNDTDLSSDEGNEARRIPKTNKANTYKDALKSDVNDTEFSSDDERSNTDNEPRQIKANHHKEASRNSLKETDSVTEDELVSKFSSYYRVTPSEDLNFEEISRNRNPRKASMLLELKKKVTDKLVKPNILSIIDEPENSSNKNSKLTSKKSTMHGDSKLTNNETKLTNDDTKLTNNTSTMFVDSQLTSNGSKLTNNKSRIILDDSQPASDDTKLIGNNLKVINDEVKLPNDSDNETTISKLENILNINHIKVKTTVRHEAKKVTASDVSHVNVYRNIDASMLKFIDKVINAVLIVHTKHKICIQPALEISDIHFTEFIKSILNRMHVIHPKLLQTVSWPCILRGYSFFMISPAGCGKTLGYIPSVCRSVSDEESSEGKGPIAIIICATGKSVLSVEKKCKALLGQYRSVLSYFYGKDEREVATMLINGVDVFITTLCAVVRLLSAPNSALDLKRLAILVLDDCERIDQVFINELKYLLLKIKDMLKNRLVKEQSVQYIVASRVWCSFMEGLAKNAPHSVVCITAFHESVIYSKAHTTVSFVESTNKIKALTDFLKELDISKRTVIVCRTNDEVKYIQTVLKELNYIVFVGDTNMTIETLYKLNDDWTQYDAPYIGAVLVCCDENLTYLNITNASYLIHYALPNMFSTFCKRFAVLTDNFASIFHDTKTDVKIKILVEETNVEQLPKILNFVKRCSNSVPESLERLSENILTNKEYIKAKTFVPICETLISFGECAYFWNCKQRHLLFTEFDSPPEWIPTKGVVNFHLRTYHDAVTYTATLISHSVNGKNINYPQTYTSLCLKINMYFMNELNRIPLGVPKLGDICAVATLNHYQRCQVVAILSKHKNGCAKDVAIRLLDEEKLERTTDAHLYELPNKFKDYNSYVVQVKLGGLMPKDKDLMFSDLAKNGLMQLSKKDEGMFMRANIIMTIGNTIIVDNLEVCQKISNINEVIVVRYDFKEELLSKHACVNEDYVHKLEELCAKCNFAINDETEEIVEVPKQKLSEPRWAHLNEDELSLVYFASAENPDKFFIRLEKFVDCLQILAKDIEEYIKDLKPLQSVRLGDYVVAQFPDDDMHYRARIDEIMDNKVKCFFVDYGDWRFVHMKNLFAITDKFVTQLPFQAIECRLAGVKPCSDSWSDFNTNYFCNLCYEGNTDYLKELYVKYYTKEQAESTNGNKYAVVIIDTSGTKDLVINHALLEANLVLPVDEEIQYLNEFIIDSTEPSNAVGHEIKENHNSHEVDQVNNSEYSVQKSSVMKYLNQIPIRSVPLVDDDYVSDEWDVEFDNGEITKMLGVNSMLPQLSGKSSFETSNQIPKLYDVINEPTETRNRVSIVEAHTSDLSDSNIKELESLPSKADETVNSSHASVNSGETLKLTPEIETPKWLKRLSNVESLLSKKKVEFDSDDISTPDSSLNSSIQVIKHPKLHWNQNKFYLNVKFEINGIKTYKINIEDDRITFFTDIDDQKYEFDIKLYGAVDVSKCSHILKGIRVYIKLKKLLRLNWLYLSRDQKKEHWISYDPDAIDTSGDENESMDHKAKIKDIIQSNYYDESDLESAISFKDDFNDL